MKKINSLLKKCKSLSKQLNRTSSYCCRGLRSQSTRNPICYYQELIGESKNHQEIQKPMTIFVGRSQKRFGFLIGEIPELEDWYVISPEHLSHPLLNALVEKSREQSGSGQDMVSYSGPGLDPDFYVKCEVVLFDHLLWMLENMDPDLSSDSLEELAELYTL